MVKLKEATYYTGNKISANTIGKLVVYKKFYNVFVDHVIVSGQQISPMQFEETANCNKHLMMGPNARETVNFVSSRPPMFP